jgi:ferritin
MSSVLKDMGLNGCASWTMLQSEERRRRALKIFGHMQERSSKIKWLPIPAPKQEWRAPLHIFEEIQRNEQKTTSQINGICEFANLEKDHETYCFLTSFINQQIKEEAKISDLLNRFRKMQSSDLGVLIFDSEIEKKVKDVHFE